MLGVYGLTEMTGDSPKVNKNACRMRQTRGAFPTGNSRCPCHQVIMSVANPVGDFKDVVIFCHQNTCVLYKLFAGVHDMTTQTLKVKRDPRVSLMGLTALNSKISQKKNVWGWAGLNKRARKAIESPLGFH